MFYKKTKQKTKQSKNGEKAVIGNVSGHKLPLPGKKGLVAIAAITLAAAGLTYYAYRTFKVPLPPPVQQAPVPTTDGNDEITPPGTIKVTPEVPEGIKHEERRPAAAG